MSNLSKVKPFCPEMPILKIKKGGPNRPPENHSRASLELTFAMSLVTLIIVDNSLSPARSQYDVDQRGAWRKLGRIE